VAKVVDSRGAGFDSSTSAVAGANFERDSPTPDATCSLMTFSDSDSFIVTVFLNVHTGTFRKREMLVFLGSSTVVDSQYNNKNMKYKHFCKYIYIYIIFLHCK